MKKVVIVQARMTSTRLPGKILLPLLGKSVLYHVLTRCRNINGIDEICCAVPVGHNHDPVALEAKKHGFLVIRGSEENVLERYYIAAKELKADYVMRITSDCPLIDAEVCQEVLNSCLQDAPIDYVSNNMPRTWPHGLDCEAFPIESLEKAYYYAQEAYDKEHVTPWIINNLKTKNIPCPLGNFSAHRWTLDTEIDYKHITYIFDKYLKNSTLSWKEIALSEVLNDA